MMTMLAGRVISVRVTNAGENVAAYKLKCNKRNGDIKREKEQERAKTTQRGGVKIQDLCNFFVEL